MRSLLTSASFLTAVLSASWAAAQVTPTVPAKVPPVQAEIQTLYTLANGRQVRTTGHFYRNEKGQIREDSPLGAVITDVAAGTVTILVTETKEARVMTVPVEQRVVSTRTNGPGPEVFEETNIGGHRVSKARGQGPQGQKVELWTATDLGVIIWAKTEAPGLSSTKEMRNLSTEEPSRALFEIPPGYTVIEQEARPDGSRQSGIPPREKALGK